MSVATVTILSNGRAVDQRMEVLALDVRREFNRIPSARLTMSDGDVPARKFPLSDGATFAPGAEIEIKARWEGEPGSETTLFKGLVVRHALELGARGVVLRVEVKDKALKMTRGRRSAVWKDVSDADVVKRLVGDAGLKAATVDATSYQHKSLVQYQCTDWDFLLTRAQALGLQVGVVDGQVSMRAPALGAAPALKIAYGIDEVYDSEFELDGLDQTPGIDGLGWDPKNQAVVKASGAAKAEPAQGSDGGAQVARALGLAARTLVHGAAIEQGELKAWADGQLTQGRLTMLRGRVSIRGRGAAALFDLVELAGVGKRFSGKGLVSALAHRIDDQGWRTDLQLGLSRGSLIDADGASVASAAGLLPAVAGLQVGIVVASAGDPQSELRVRVKLPALGDAAEVWARWAFPDAGKGRGIVFWPEPGDEVVLGFFNDDPRQPVVLGSLFSSKQPPAAPYDQPDDKNLVRGFFTKSGCEIGFVDDDKPKLFLRTKAKREVVLDDDGKLISIADADGNTLSVDSNGITLHSAKDLKLEADGNVEIKGAKIDLK
jgi:uncharacterized protein involved in type VI secretion and phage assembly